jgi:hypothetical protein
MKKICKMSLLVNFATKKYINDNKSQYNSPKSRLWDRDFSRKSRFRANVLGAFSLLCGKVELEIAISAGNHDLEIAITEICTGCK